MQGARDNAGDELQDLKDTLAPIGWKEASKEFMRQTRCVRAHALGHGLLMTSVDFWLDSYVMALAAIGRVLQARARTVLQLVIQEYFLQLPVQP